MNSKPLSNDTDSDSSLHSSKNETRATPTSPDAFELLYSNFDPRFMQQSQSEFLFPEGAKKQRGRHELAYSQIGSSIIVGAGIGGLTGLYNSMKTAASIQQTGKLRRTQIFNHILKPGSATASTFGVLALYYSAFGVMLEFARGKDDELNTVLAGTATGLLYKSSAGVRKCAAGGGVGLVISTLYVLFKISRNGWISMPTR